MIILHFALINEWDENEQIYSNKEGFIKCYKVSDAENLKLSFSTLKDYVILCIDESKITSEIKYENDSNSGLETANIYGELNKEAVIKVLPYTFDSEDNFIVTDEILDFNIINEVLNKLNINYESYKYFNDGTSSKIILLNNAYIIKQTDSTLLEGEVIFSNFYNDVEKLQKIAYFEPNYKYVVYSYIPGDVMHVITDFEDIISNIKQIVSSYKTYEKEGFGYLSNPVENWTDFLKNEVSESSLLLPDINNLLPEINEAFDELSKYPFEKKLLHGDFGTHNFIKEDEKFKAAIDPTPIIGDSTYDLIFALVSNIDLLPNLSIDFLTEFTSEPREKIVALFKILLYIRICRCAKYNKEWIETYMDYWYNLFN